MKKIENARVKIIPLGGLELIGMNITAFEYDDSIVRYLVSSIRVTEDMHLIVNIKGGGSITEPLFCEK